MESVNVNGMKLEYEMAGSGDPVLLISPVLADGFLPLLAEPALSDRFQLIRYHRRGWAGSKHAPLPATIADHAADAAAFLDSLGIPRAHIAGHSSGGAIAIQLALDHPDSVHTLVLLEPSLFSMPSSQTLLQRAQPAFDAYTKGDHDKAFATFMSAVSGLDWATCHDLLEERVPGAVAQAITDADTFFGIELPAVAAWAFSAEQAATIQQPVLSLLGDQTEPLWIEVAAFLRKSLPHVEQRTIERVGHLLHLQRPEPVVHAIADFLARNPIKPTPSPQPRRTRPSHSASREPMPSPTAGSANR